MPRAARPNVAVLPWGATEAHNFHLPHGTDVIEAVTLAERAAAKAHDAGGRPIVLPAIPFGNDAQQLDQVATISLSTTTALHLLRDVVRSLKAQGIDRLVIVNAHGGNQFQPLVRDVQSEFGGLIVGINFWQLLPDRQRELFSDPGDHAGQLETAFLLHVAPDWVMPDQAGEGSRVPFALESLGQPGVWTPRPWSQSHPDTGSGNPAGATAQAGEQFIDAATDSIAAVLVELSQAQRGQLPYV